MKIFHIAISSLMMASSFNISSSLANDATYLGYLRSKFEVHGGNKPLLIKYGVVAKKVNFSSYFTVQNKSNKKIAIVTHEGIPGYVQHVADGRIAAIYSALLYSGADVEVSISDYTQRRYVGYNHLMEIAENKDRVSSTFADPYFGKKVDYVLWGAQKQPGDFYSGNLSLQTKDRLSVTTMMDIPNWSDKAFVLKSGVAAYKKLDGYIAFIADSIKGSEKPVLAISCGGLGVSRAPLLAISYLIKEAMKDGDRKKVAASLQLLLESKNALSKKMMSIVKILSANEIELDLYNRSKNIMNAFFGNEATFSNYGVLNDSSCDKSISSELDVFKEELSVVSKDSTSIDMKKAREAIKILNQMDSIIADINTQIDMFNSSAFNSSESPLPYCFTTLQVDGLMGYASYSVGS